MRGVLPFWSPLLLVLVAAVAVARVREPIERTLILSEHPRSEASRVYVGGRVATVLRFEKPCDSERTNSASTARARSSGFIRAHSSSEGARG
jgi:hypothetical protein